MTLPTHLDPRWPRLLARDPTADFYYSVATTGVYCRAGCASRAASPANVTIHGTLAEARASGARPCRRCDPDGVEAAARTAAVEAACRRLAEEDAPGLDALAAAAEMSAGHFHRLFRAATGLTPKAYARAARAERMRDALATEPRVTDAIYAAGYAAPARFYADAGARLGMTPAAFARGGAMKTLRVAVTGCALGRVLVAASDKGVAAILLGDNDEALRDDLARRFPKATLVAGDADFAALVAQAVAVVDGTTPAADLPLDIRGTAFQQRVWAALRALRRGETLSYAELAARIGAPQAVRAVAGACAANALAVAIPCHRVLRGDGALSGYRWGVARKRALLDREAG